MMTHDDEKRKTQTPPFFLLYFFFIKIKSSVQRERGAYVCELFLIKKLAGS